MTKPDQLLNSFNHFSEVFYFRNVIKTFRLKNKTKTFKFVFLNKYVKTKKAGDGIYGKIVVLLFLAQYCL